MLYPFVHLGFRVAVVTLSFCVFGFSAADEPPALNPKDKLIVETVLRLKDFDIESSPPAKAAMLRYLRAQPGTDQFFELIDRFKLVDIDHELAEFALAHSTETGGVRAADLLFKLKREQPLSDAMAADDSVRAAAAVTLIGHAGGSKTSTLLSPLVKASDKPLAVRSAAVVALGRREDGQNELLRMVADGLLAEDLKFAAANVLLSSEVKTIQQEAAKYLKLPATADSQPLPPTTELVARRGNAEAGAIVFRTKGTCSNCHKVRGEGKEVGPDLSEIGSKLSREAMYVSILDPSAAISHNFETFQVLTDDGTTVNGLLVSDTDESITLRTAEGIAKTVAKDSVEIFKKQPLSLMPQNLQQMLTVEQLVDLVEYTLSLTK